MLFVEPSDLPVFQLLDPLGWFKDSVAEGDVEVGHLPVVVNVPIRGPFEYVFIVSDVVVKLTDLFVEAANFADLLGIASGDGCKEPLFDGLEDVSVEVRVGCQGGHNGTRRHRWFWTLNRTNRERDVVFDG